MDIHHFLSQLPGHLRCQIMEDVEGRPVYDCLDTDGPPGLTRRRLVHSDLRSLLDDPTDLDHLVDPSRNCAPFLIGLSLPYALCSRHTYVVDASTDIILSRRLRKTLTYVCWHAKRRRNSTMQAALDGRLLGVASTKPWTTRIEATKSFG
ncbi:2og-fe oxygenase family protein [Cystoisospora suis]|uniref:2og-fe oxygenase family protein n=1 Tax=Cystoisospora suis TaxID=483139 RepID=A0A2C6LCH5_9APIC|nr:2og-fe oxygenase family protein [Cystoisospora suis]